MTLMAGILRTIILLGAIQGFIVGALLVSSARRDRGGARQKRLLAILIGLLAMACLNLYLFETPEWMNTPLGNLLNALIPLIVVMPVGPLLYGYVRSLLEPGFRLHRRHFYSTAIDLFPHAATLVYIILLILGLLNPQKNYGFGTFLDDYQQYADIPRWLSLAVYLWMASRTLKRARTLGRPEALQLTWPETLIRVFSAFAILWFVFLVPYEIPRTSNWLLDRFDWYPDRLWLDPTLNLAGLARHCDLPPKTLSTVLNQHLEKPFNTWVNEYRIAAFKDKVSENRELTIAGLAYDCGFNSLPTFQRAFKSLTGITPSEYQKRLIKSGSE